MKGPSDDSADDAMRKGMEELIVGMRGPAPAPELGGEATEATLAPSDGADSRGEARWEEVMRAPRKGGHDRPRMLEVGALVGRYVILSRLGAGGMGVVYSAYDPELDRKVALKLLRPGVDGEKGKARLQREAQALGKLAHPHVVGLYDVGTLGEQVWLAMEFVRGQTLGAWLKTPRSWREVLEAMVSAGEGLAAAHAAGLLHRDFKPENVMVGDDGRVRVMDFGLARARPEGESTGDEEARPVPNVEALAMELTQTGTLLGTPSYMAPEQFSHASITAAADQFAFCVALWEALYGERPFRGETLMVLIANVLAGRQRPAPKERKVPSRLRRACERGLAVEPEQRWPSLDALLEELRRLVVPPVRRWVAGVGVGLAVVAGGLAWQQSTVITEQGEQLTEKEKQLQEQVVELQERGRRLANELAAQQGMLAKVLAESAGHELEAVAVAVAAFDGFDARVGSVPAPVIEGLTHALAGVDRGIALRGHESWVVAVAVSADGQRIATASKDNTVRLWDGHSGAFLRRIEGHDGPVHAVAFSSDGTRVATASEDQTVRVWDTETAVALESLRHQGPVRSVAFSPDGTRIAAASGDAVWVWQEGPDAIVVPFAGHTGRVRSVAFSPDGTRLVTASEDQTSRIWNAATGAVLRTLEGHTGPVYDLAVSRDGTRIATGGRDETARLWDAATGQPLASFEHGEVVYAVAFSPDGTKLATGTFDDGAARVWDVATRKQLAIVRHEDAVVDVAFSPGGDQLVTASLDFTARSWNLEASRALVGLPLLSRVDAVAFSPDGSRVATGSGDGSAQIWDARSGAHLATLHGHRIDVLSVAFSPDGSTLATASWDGSVRVWGVGSAEHRTTLRGHTEPVRAVAFSSDGAWVATASRDGTARVWDATTGEELRSFLHGVAVVDVEFDPQGRRLATVGADDRVRMWSTATGEALVGLPHEGLVTAVAWSSDGRRIAAATKDAVVHVWDAESGDALASLRGHTAAVRSMTFSRDRATLATGSEDGTARVWELATEEQRVAFPHAGPVTSVALSPDGTHLATASGDDRAWLWSLQAGPWVEWGCGVLDGRSAHREATLRACMHTMARATTSEDEATVENAEPMVTNAGDLEAPEVITVHGVELVLIPGGTFTMGSPPREAGRSDREGPQHEVTLESFYLARTPVTNAQYAMYLEANPEAAKPREWEYERFNQPEQPVVALTWYEAKAYCDWAGLVLPTEAQWEYAARAGTSTAYWFGDDAKDLERFDWYDANSGRIERGFLGSRPRSVTTKGSNPWGLFNMHGNVAQWTLDYYAPYTTSVRAGHGLRKGPAGGVVRGGTFGGEASNARSARRDGWEPDGLSINFGFRPARGHHL